MTAQMHFPVQGLSTQNSVTQNVGSQGVLTQGLATAQPSRLSLSQLKIARLQAQIDELVAHILTLPLPCHIQLWHEHKTLHIIMLGKTSTCIGLKVSRRYSEPCQIIMLQHLFNDLVKLTRQLTT